METKLDYVQKQIPEVKCADDLHSYDFMMALC